VFSGQFWHGKRKEAVICEILKIRRGKKHFQGLKEHVKGVEFLDDSFKRGKKRAKVGHKGGYLPACTRNITARRGGK